MKIIESALLFPSSFCQLNPKVTHVKLKSLLISVWYGFLLDHCLRSCFVSLVFQSSFILPKFSGLNSYSLQNQRTEICNFLFILCFSKYRETKHLKSHAIVGLCQSHAEMKSLIGEPNPDLSTYTN